MSWIYHKICSLPTPCGEITVRDENGEPCRFSVEKNFFCSDYTLYHGTEEEEAVNTDTNYDICIHTEDLAIGHVYKIALTGCRLRFGDSDEHTQAVSGTSNGYSIAIGSYDPNDEEKLDQAYAYSREQGFLSRIGIMPPPQYDESRFVQYDVEMLEDHSGFWFRLIDRSLPEVTFSVAWIKNEHDDPWAYEGAVGYWTT